MENAWMNTAQDQKPTSPVVPIRLGLDDESGEDGE
jgi:hypothetical protein